MTQEDRDVTIETLNERIKELEESKWRAIDLNNIANAAANALENDNKRLLEENEKMLKEGEEIVKKYNDMQRLLDVDDKAKRIQSQEIKIKSLMEINERHNKTILEQKNRIEVNEASIIKKNEYIQSMKKEHKEEIDFMLSNKKEKIAYCDHSSLDKQIKTLEQYQKIDNEKLAEERKKNDKLSVEIKELETTIVEMVKGKVLRSN